MEMAASLDARFKTQTFGLAAPPCRQTRLVRAWLGARLGRHPVPAMCFERRLHSILLLVSEETELVLS